MNNIKNINTKIKNEEIEVPIEDFLNLIGLGQNAENFQLPSPQLLQYYYDRKDRVIWIDKEIGDDLFNEIKQIAYWIREDDNNKINPEDRKPIRLMIHSYGGDLDSCFALIDLMGISKTPIYTYNMNACMSAGALIYINGHKRYAMPLSIVLLHQGTGGAGGQYEQVIAQTENYKKLINMIKENILKQTTIPKSTLNKKFNTEWYIYAEDQIKYGITDEIITKDNFTFN